MRRGQACGDVILSVEDLAVHFPIGGGLFGGDGGCCARLTASNLQLGAASASVWSANPVAASRRLQLSILGLQMPTAAASCWTGGGGPAGIRAIERPWPASCKWCFRILRLAQSTPDRPSHAEDPLRLMA